MTNGIATSAKCHNCAFNTLCLPMGLNKYELGQLEQLIQKQREIKRREHLFHIGDPFRRLYAIKRGSFKSYTINTDGDEQINGFNLTAELLGLDGVYSQQHCVSLVALENSLVCELPFDQLLILAAKIPQLQHQLFHIISHNYTAQFQVNINTHAETRFAAFLLNISRRVQERGFQARDFTLKMSREEIGNYLGLASETISRLFNKFEEKNILAIKCRRVYLYDLRALQILSCI
jgi:CRP/FNR family transcriptional regulator